MIQSPFASACSTSHSQVPLAKSLITRSTATPQPSIIIPVWPVGTKTAARPACAGRPAELEGDAHLADRAVGADGQDHVLARAVGPADGRLLAARRPAVVDDRDAGGLGRGGELGVVADERVQPGQDVEAGRDRLEDRPAPGAGQLAAGRGDPDEQGRRGAARSGRGPARRRGEATIGMSKRGPAPSQSWTFRPAFVESITATIGSGP